MTLGTFIIFLVEIGAFSSAFLIFLIVRWYNSKAEAPNIKGAEHKGGEEFPEEDEGKGKRKPKILNRRRM